SARSASIATRRSSDLHVQDVLDLESAELGLPERARAAPARHRAAYQKDRKQRRAPEDAQGKSPVLQRAVTQARAHAREERQLDDQIGCAIVAVAEGGDLPGEPAD